MTKKKGKRKTATKSANKSAAKKGKEPNPAGVRKAISLLVEEHAEKMAEAVINEGKKGQLPTVKYLFEVASIFPPRADGSESSAEEDSLAKTLMHRLNLPEEPMVRDEEGEVVRPALPAAQTEEDVEELAAT